MYLSALRQNAWQTNWTMTNARAGALCLPIIAAWALLGIISHQHESAVLAVAGAFTVGFAAFQRILSRPIVPMLITLGGVAAATFLGCSAAQVGWVAVVAVATVCGFVFGAVTVIGYGAWWIGLQCMIGLLVYGAHPAPLRAAVGDALFVLAGGGSQLVFLAIVLPWTHRWFKPQVQAAFDTNDPIYIALARNVHPRSLAGRYATRVALAMLLAATINHFATASHWLKLANAYWIPMTAVILLKPDRQETVIRGINRLCGTLAGAGVTTTLLATLRPRHEELGLMLLLAIWSAYTLQRVNYALFATCVTAYVVILLSALGLPDLEVALHRLEATLVGAVIALVVHWIPLPSRERIL